MYRRFLILFILLCASICIANPGWFSADYTDSTGSIAYEEYGGGGTCSTYLSQITGTSTSWTFGKNTTIAYAGNRNFDFGSNESVCTIAVKVGKVGTPTTDVRIKIFTMSGTSLGSIITNGTSDAVNGASFSSEDVVEFTFQTHPSVSNGTLYGVAAHTDSYDNTNYYYLVATTGSDVISGAVNQWQDSKNSYTTDATGDIYIIIKTE